MKQLNADIKSGELKQIYLLYGEENYLKKQYRDRLRAAIAGEEDSMNVSAFSEKGIDVREVISIADTMPFFAERRLIVIENSGFFKKASPELAEYMEQVPETTCFIFVEEEVDKRNKLYKTVSKHGYVSEMKRQDDRTLTRWVMGLVKREGKQISESAARHLIQTTGDDMENLQQELEKLFCYTMHESVIRQEDIDTICTTQITNHIFDMVDAVAEKRQQDALQYYYDLLVLREPPMRILFLLIRQFRLVMEVKELLQRHASRPEISEKTGIRSFAVRRYEQQAQYFTMKELRNILEDGAKTEQAVKTGLMDDRLGVEVFIVKYSTK
jgi:DNA polymerase-3 subunit delta